jgi:hypothetical protein
VKVRRCRRLSTPPNVSTASSSQAVWALEMWLLTPSAVSPIQNTVAVTAG